MASAAQLSPGPAWKWKLEDGRVRMNGKTSFLQPTCPFHIESKPVLLHQAVQGRSRTAGLRDLGQLGWEIQDSWAGDSKSDLRQRDDP